MVREALRLEREAAARYSEHPAASSDPRLVTYWESLRRNEAEHRAPASRPGCEPTARTRTRRTGRAPADAGVLDGGEHPGGRRRPAPAGSGGGTASAATPPTWPPCAPTTTSRTRPSRIYGHFAYRAEDPELMELFKELARGEAGHRNGLRRTIRTVEDPATPVILFCPLCGWAHRLRPGPRGGHGGQVPHVPRTIRAASGRERRLDPGEAGPLR